MRLPLALCTKKNLLHDLGAWIVLLDINITPILNYTEWATATSYVVDDLVQFRGISYTCIQNHTSAYPTYPVNDFTNWSEVGMLRLCEAKNLDNITWPTTNGYLYTRFQFDIDNVSEQSSGEVPSAVLKISNINGYMETYADAYNGFKDANVSIRVVHTAELGERAIPAHVYSITTSGTNDTWMNFSLGALNPHKKPVMKDVIYKSFCRYEEFQGTRCRFGQNVWIEERPYNNHTIWHDRPDGESSYVPYKAKSGIPITESIAANRPCLNPTDWEDMSWDVDTYYETDDFIYHEGTWYNHLGDHIKGFTPGSFPTVWEVLSCDRSLDTCRTRFHNSLYFGGFVGLATEGVLG